MSQAQSDSVSGDVNFGDPQGSRWMIAGFVVLGLAIAWLALRRK